jgi:hypothetical protein
MDETKMPLIPNGKTPCARNGQTLGELMKLFRGGYDTIAEYAKTIGVSAEYLSDVENDKRYPPTGGVWRKLVQTYSKMPEQEFGLFDCGGMSRIEVRPEVSEFLRRNIYARILVERLMQTDFNPLDNSGIEDAYIEMDACIDKIAKIVGVKLKPVAPDPDEENYEEKLQEYLNAVKELGDANTEN